MDIRGLGYDSGTQCPGSGKIQEPGRESSQHVSGKLFEVEGGKLSIADGWRKGPEKDKGDRWEPAELGAVVDDPVLKPVYASSCEDA